VILIESAAEAAKAGMGSEEEAALIWLAVRGVPKDLAHWLPRISIFSEGVGMHCIMILRDRFTKNHPTFMSLS